MGLIYDSSIPGCVDSSEISNTLEVGSIIFSKEDSLPVNIIQIDLSETLAPENEIFPLLSDHSTLAIIDATCDPKLNLSENISNAGLLGFVFTFEEPITNWDGIKEVKVIDLISSELKPFLPSDEVYFKQLSIYSRSKVDSPTALLIARWYYRLIEAVQKTKIPLGHNTIGIPLYEMRIEMSSFSP